MATYKEYKTSKGTFWQVRGYLGIDTLTGLEARINKKGFKTKKAAQRAYRQAVVDFEQGTQRNKYMNLTYLQVYHEWLEAYKNTVRESTLKSRMKLFELNILPIFGKIRINMISGNHLQDAINKWHKQFSTYKRVYNLCIKVLDFAQKRGYIQKNPSYQVIVPTNKVTYDFEKQKHGKQYYSKDELKQLMSALETMKTKKWLCFFRILAFGGLRRGEALALTYGDIDFKNGLIRINKTLSQGHNNRLKVELPKDGDPRTVSIDPITLNIIKEWRLEQRKNLIGFGYNAMSNDQLLFSKYKNNTWLDPSAPRNALVRICEAHGLELIKIHGFRHTHVTLLMEAGIPYTDIMDRMGHSELDVTKIYTHITKDALDNTAQKFAKYVNF